MAAGETLDVMLRSARVRAGLSQAELAARAGVTRQAISAIETGKANPTIEVALRLARVLGRRVEELFQLVDELPTVAAEVVGAEAPLSSPVRVQVAAVGDRLLARPLLGSAGTVLALPRANGLLRSSSVGDRRVLVDLFCEPEQLQQTVVAIGCDPAMGLLADHLRRRHPPMEMAGLGGNSLDALAAVARGEAHVAGTHLFDPMSGEYNIPFARRLLGDDARLVTFAVWEQGLLLPAGNPKGIRSVADLARPDVRLVNRESGSGARALLDAELSRFGILVDQVQGYQMIVRSHLAAAEVVAAGLADVAIGVRAAARAFGLHFVPLAAERYDLAIPACFYELPPIQALLETLTSLRFRREVEALGGYDVSAMGTTLSAAA